MNRKDFLNVIIEECELEPDEEITEDTELESLEDWDSLAFITLLSLFKNNFKFSPDVNELRKCKTFKEILDFAGDKYED